MSETVELESNNKRRYIDVVDEEVGDDSTLKKFKDEKLSDNEEIELNSSEEIQTLNLNKSDCSDEQNILVEESNIDEKSYEHDEEESDTNSSSSDELIELDSDSDGENACDEKEEEEISQKLYQDETQESNDGDSMEEHSLKSRMLRYNPRFYMSRLLLKKSIKILLIKSAKEEKKRKNNQILDETSSEMVILKTDEDHKESEASTTTIQEKIDETISCLELETEMIANETTIENTKMPQMEIVNDNSCEEKLKLNASTLMDDLQDESVKSPPLKIIENNLETVECQNESNAKKTKEDQLTNKNPSSSSSNEKQEQQPRDEDYNSLMTEISKSSIEEIMNRYVFRTDGNNSDEKLSTEEFFEDLFVCLQQNKHELFIAQQVWNEKLHIKYKIRELMERLRRNKAVNEIENFGYKPLQQQDNFNPMVSSKSSTTNSENDHFDKSSRMSSESVSRLIQDVRANVLKREEKQKTIDPSNIGENTIYDDISNSFSHLQSNQFQGRQGQIIDVQSIINDFRKNHPQEVPRRGRRVKNSYTTNVLCDNQHAFSSLNRIEANSRTNEINSSKSSTNTGGFPEVSLLPVSNFYKNLSQNTSGSSQTGQHQRSSLLQSILTKSSKNNFQHMNSTSTLARLLTAPERDRAHQNSLRSMNMTDARQSNGEITITPIAGIVRKQEFSMDDEDNSNETPLIIDEQDDFEMSNRNKEEMLLCQGCKKNKALFMCAGCSKQWYCSKNCQEAAWDLHADMCMV